MKNGAEKEVLMPKFDFWYGDTIEDVNGASAVFYPNEGVYRGNLYKDEKIVGDYVATDSVAIEKLFPGIFCN